MTRKVCIGDQVLFPLSETPIDGVIDRNYIHNFKPIKRHLESIIATSTVLMTDDSVENPTLSREELTNMHKYLNTIAREALSYIPEVKP